MRRIKESEIEALISEAEQFEKTGAGLTLAEELALALRDARQERDRAQKERSALRLWVAVLRDEVAQSLAFWSQPNPLGGQQAGSPPHRFPLSFASRLVREATRAIRGEPLLAVEDPREIEKAIAGLEALHRLWEERGR